MSLKLCVVIPAYNEEDAIGRTIDEYKAVFPEARFVVIDNNSTDATFERAKDRLDPATDLLLSESRQGKGFAVKRGLSRVSADVYVMTDGDLTYPAHSARRLLEILLAERPDMVVGDRVSGGAYEAQNARPGHSFGNRLLTAVISRLSGQRYADVLSGLRIMSRPYVKMLDVRSTGFQLETEMNVIAAHLRADVMEVPIEYRQREDGSDSKLDTVRDGLRILSFAITHWIAFLPMQSFVLVAALALGISGVLGVRVITAFLESGFTAMPYPSSAVAAAATGMIGIQALFSGVILRLLARNDRRRDIADFLEARREWNDRLDKEA